MVDSVLRRRLDRGMKAILFALFVALLMVGCGHKSKELEGDDTESKQVTARTLDLDDNETLNRIIAEATNGNDLKEHEDEGLTYTINGIDESKKTFFSGWAKERYENGQLYSLVQFKDGKMEGLWKKWNNQGLKQLEGRTRNGKLMSCKSWRPNGEKCPLTNLKNGNGIVISYDSNGSEEGRWSYSNGELKRTLTMTKRFYDTGMLRGEGLAYEKEGNSKRHGLWTIWYEAGQEWEETILKKSIRYAEGKYFDDKKNGLWTTYYENGQKQSESNYKDGKFMSAEVWKPNGEKCPDTNVKDGKGVRVAYNEDGQKWMESNYKEGKMDGLRTRWHKNGQKAVEENYKEGKEDGLMTWWFENGQKSVEGNYKDGKYYGLWIFYNEDGTESGRETIKDGELVED
jgi:antitoxin component YwqK of YwqJK toxin-antitoxin module